MLLMLHLYRYANDSIPYCHANNVALLFDCLKSVFHTFQFGFSYIKFVQKAPQKTMGILFFIQFLNTNKVPVVLTLIKSTQGSSIDWAS